MKNETDTYLLLEKLNNISMCLTNLSNSLTVILGTPEESCEHYTINQAQKDIHAAINLVAKR